MNRNPFDIVIAPAPLPWSDLEVPFSWFPERTSITYDLPSFLATHPIQENVVTILILKSLTKVDQQLTRLDESGKHSQALHRRVTTLKGKLGKTRSPPGCP